MQRIISKAAIHAGYKLNFLEKTGLTIVKKNENIDRFRGRVVFPIRSMSGRILGFVVEFWVLSKILLSILIRPKV